MQPDGDVPGESTDESEPAALGSHQQDVRTPWVGLLQSLHRFMNGEFRVRGVSLKHLFVDLVRREGSVAVPCNQDFECVDHFITTVGRRAR